MPVVEHNIGVSLDSSQAATLKNTFLTVEFFKSLVCNKRRILQNTRPVLLKRFCFLKKPSSNSNYLNTAEKYRTLFWDLNLYLQITQQLLYPLNQNQTA